MEDKIILALDDIRPFLKADGGDVRFIEYIDGVIKVELLGACKDCSMSSMTVKAGIEETIKTKVPEVTEVIAVSTAELNANMA